MYTINDLELAQIEMDQWNERWDNYSGNNPNKYQSNIKIAARKVRTIAAYLKKTGAISSTEQEILEQNLDKVFPNAKSREIVEYESRKYQRRFWPIEKSRSGKTVTQWGKGWV